jgi:hypothetical protein
MPQKRVDDRQSPDFQILDLWLGIISRLFPVSSFYFNPEVEFFAFSHRF